MFKYRAWETPPIREFYQLIPRGRQSIEFAQATVKHRINSIIPVLQFDMIFCFNSKSGQRSGDEHWR